MFMWLLTKAFFVPLVGILAVYLGKKWLNIQVSKEQKEKINEYVGDAVSYADQKMKKWLDEGEKPEDTHAKRMQWAKDFLSKALETELDDKLVDWLEAKIESQLGKENKDKVEKKLAEVKEGKE